MHIKFEFKKGIILNKVYFCFVSNFWTFKDNTSILYMMHNSVMNIIKSVKWKTKLCLRVGIAVVCYILMFLLLDRYVDVLIILTCDCYDGVKLIDGII